MIRVARCGHGKGGLGGGKILRALGFAVSLADSEMAGDGDAGQQGQLGLPMRAPADRAGALGDCVG